VRQFAAPQAPAASPPGLDHSQSRFPSLREGLMYQIWRPTIDPAILPREVVSLGGQAGGGVALQGDRRLQPQQGNVVLAGQVVVLRVQVDLGNLDRLPAPQGEKGGLVREVPT
jgi:hypothetical protein